ncbi:Holliday junction branch migration protein RuvA [Limosilactobacillus ingluviei]|uniref:Holliday junction branch migration protein RuvA n=1 Tax=Limosilactobacillus ingluviei TaxID=148604 RepID=UPI0002DE6599|nr:Holliday junction branch migration protein RuvA [Limosilactobacillus ingluviei]
MYEYLNGQVAMVTPTYIVLDVNGVGYRIAVANPYAYEVDQQTAVRVYVYQAVKEDSLTLFGFSDPNEKQLFEKLLGVSGIGPKSALAILANPDHQALIQAIGDNDVNYLTKFPGIGKKTAARIVVELQDKVDALWPDLTLDFTVRPTSAAQSPALADALAALASLGYAERDIKRVEKQLLKEPDQPTAEYLRAGLRLLNK